MPNDIGKPDPGPILGATNAQLETRVKSLETWRTAVAMDAYKAATDARLVKLEAAGGGTVDLSAIEARLAKLEALTCPQQTVLDGIAADLVILKTDHLSTP